MRGKRGKRRKRLVVVLITIIRHGVFAEGGGVCGPIDESIRLELFVCDVCRIVGGECGGTFVLSVDGFCVLEPIGEGVEVGLFLLREFGGERGIVFGAFFQDGC